MPTSLAPVEQIVIIKQLQDWTTRILTTLNEGEKLFLDTDNDRDIFSKNDDDVAIINEHLRNIVAAADAWRDLYVKVRQYDGDGMAALTSLVATKPLVNGTTVQGLSWNVMSSEMFNNVRLALFGLMNQTGEIKKAVTNWQTQSDKLRDACDYVEQLLRDDAVKTISSQEDVNSKTLATLSDDTAKALGSTATPSDASARSKLVQERWTKVAAAEKARAKDYRRFRLSQNTLSALEPIASWARELTRGFEPACQSKIDDAAIAFRDMWACLLCGDVVELKRILDQDILSANKDLTNITNWTLIQQLAFKGAEWNSTSQEVDLAKQKSKSLKLSWQDPHFGSNTVYGLSQVDFGTAWGGSVGVSMDSASHTLTMELSGTNTRARAHYLNIADPPERAQTGNVVLKPSGIATPSLQVVFTQGLENAQVFCWLTKFSIDDLGKSGIKLEVDKVTIDGFRIKAQRAAGGQNDIGIGWLAYSGAGTQRVNVKAQNLSGSLGRDPFVPEKWKSGENWSSDLWPRKLQARHEFDNVDILPRVAAFVSAIPACTFQATTQYGTRDTTLVHIEPRGEVNAVLVASKQYDLDMVFIPPPDSRPQIQ